MADVLPHLDPEVLDVENEPALADLQEPMPEILDHRFSIVISVNWNDLYESLLNNWHFMFVAIINFLVLVIFIVVLFINPIRKAPTATWHQSDPFYQARTQPYFTVFNPEFEYSSSIAPGLCQARNGDTFCLQDDPILPNLYTCYPCKIGKDGLWTADDGAIYRAQITEDEHGGVLFERVVEEE